MPESPSDVSMRQRIAALRRWSQEDGIAGTAAARAAGPGRLPYWEAHVDPDSELPPDERARRAERAKKAYFVELALKSARARRRER
jgi:hypothetical protein